MIFAFFYSLRLARQIYDSQEIIYYIFVQCYSYFNFNPLVPNRTLKYVFSKKSFRYFFSHNTSISYSILKI